VKEFTEDQKNLSLEFNEFLKVAFASLVFDYECLSLYIFQSHEQLSSNAGWSKLDFAQRDKCKPVLLRLSLARNLEKSVPLLDRMEGARLPPQRTIAALRALR